MTTVDPRGLDACEIRIAREIEINRKRRADKPVAQFQAGLLTVAELRDALDRIARTVTLQG